MTKSENNALKKAQKHGNTAQITSQKLILSHLNILDLEEDNDTIDDYDC